MDYDGPDEGRRTLAADFNPITIYSDQTSPRYICSCLLSFSCGRTITMSTASTTTNPLLDCSRERSVFLNSTLLLTLFYGIYVVLFMQATYRISRRVTNMSHRSVNNNPITTKNRLSVPFLGLASVAIVIYMMVTGVFVLRWVITSDALASNSASAEYLCETVLSPSMVKLWEAFTGFSTVLFSVFMVCRCWVVYAQDWKLIVLPGLAGFVETVMVFLSLFYSSAYFSPRDEPIYDILSGSSNKYNLICTCLSLVVSVYCTVAIIACIVRFHRMSAVDMIAESGIVYSVSSLLNIIMVTVSARWGMHYTMTMMPVVAGIMPIWILSRIESGHGRSDESWGFKPNSLALGLDPEQSSSRQSSTSTN